ncbi:MAG: PilZ domain-containing protein [Deltaproteobacteria bacterium]|nr:PilZ domain-containing protein [Deltaproteobacteria bacterium]MBK9643650.1 PilZ domain-containing protein [Deltaproteobacteria bacterium]
MNDPLSSSALYAAALPVSLGVFEPDQHTQTLAVSKQGALLDLQGGPPVGEMIWLHIQLPKGVTIEATATIRPRNADLGDGVPVEFSMFMHGSRGVWNQFMGELELAASEGGRDRRVWTRERHVSLLVRAQEREWVSGDVSQGGVFVPSKILLPEGTSFKLELIHPDTQHVFVVQARVARLQYGHGGDVRGMGLEFLGMDDERRFLLQRFYTQGVAPL